MLSAAHMGSQGSNLKRPTIRLNAPDDVVCRNRPCDALAALSIKNKTNDVDVARLVLNSWHERVLRAELRCWQQRQSTSVGTIPPKVL